MKRASGAGSVDDPRAATRPSLMATQPPSSSRRWSSTVATDHASRSRRSARPAPTGEVALVLRERLPHFAHGQDIVATGEQTRAREAAHLVKVREGRFEIELPRCENAATGEALGWPPAPLVLHGSFDRLRSK